MVTLPAHLTPHPVQTKVLEVYVLPDGGFHLVGPAFDRYTSANDQLTLTFGETLIVGQTIEGQVISQEINCHSVFAPSEQPVSYE